ncbi:class I SAM-dependent methyltransferase [Albidovulum sediminicola]|uniref:Class I SAM-dependent methyltransferase n=1 Tax=Albidovulum sediminicola TaxID=2984331 RepID=A0ABT2Z535_9RHOB|nr:class I SAM-dependent methyltransferase [Defluviimonas sp. WL0075]MCV2866250.1 class I SAM-dependent methyltransferase [Defluviimonas sp. WL0075]
MDISNWLPMVSYRLPRSRKDCPLCGSEQSESLADLDRRLKRLPHVKCGQCGFVRQFPLPTPEALADYYATQYRADYQGQSAAPTPHHIAKRRKEAERRFAILQPLLKPGAAVLDCGCGSGEFVELLSERGYAASGFEPGQGYATYARDEKGLDVTCAGYSDFQPKRTYDAATSFHVFEHLTDPLDAFARLAAFVGPEGLIHIEVPNMENALVKGFGCLHLAHTIGFTRPTLELMAAKHGFAVAVVEDAYDIGMVFRRGQPRDLEEIMADGRAALARWNRETVHRQFWRYTFGKLLPGGKSAQ